MSVLEAIKYRRSIFPSSYIAAELKKEDIMQILEAANYAPSHKLTEPWRFRVFYGKGLEKFSTFASNLYKTKTPKEAFSEFKYEKNKNNLLKAGAIIAVSVQKTGIVPAVEEICATACAVQNMLLATEALDLGAYWSTGSGTFSDETREFLQLNAEEDCLGFVYIGTHNLPKTAPKRGDIAQKISWIEE